MDTKPIWLLREAATRFPKMERDMEVDVLVVGGGIMGVTAAYLLKRAGVKVALVERGQIANGESGHTTAHLACVTDLRLTKLVRSFGRDHAQAAWDAGQYAIDEIFAIASQEKIMCDLRRVPGYLFAALDSDASVESEELHREAHLADELGFDAAYVSPAPVVSRPAIRFANQAKFHPAHYIRELAHRIPGAGCHVFEQTTAAEFHDSPRRAVANGFTIRFKHCVIATHVPMQGLSTMMEATLRQTKLAGYSTFATGWQIPKAHYPEALLWDTSDPYLYLRFDSNDAGDYAIVGGEDYKTGQRDAQESFTKLAHLGQFILHDGCLDRRWSGQVIETADGLPYIGETDPGQFIATGFGGNGMTFGTLAAIMARDWVIGVTNPWTELFSVKRKKLSAAWDYLRENKDYPYYLAKGRLRSADAIDLSEVRPGEGRIVRVDGKKAAVYRSDDGVMTVCSAVCPHLGCIVEWNSAENTWDCPCHGSRFQATGDVIAGPAEKPLELISCDEPALRSSHGDVPASGISG